MKPWLRLDAHYSDDPRLVSAGWPLRALWPCYLALLKRESGVLSEEHTNATYMAHLFGGEFVVWLEALADAKEWGLLVEGSRSVKVGRAPAYERRGWITPRWDEYQPDSRANSRRRDTERPRDNTSVPGTNGTSPGPRARAVASRRVESRPVVDPVPQIESGPNKNVATPAEPDPRFGVGSPPYDLAIALRGAIREHTPDTKHGGTPAKLQGWAKAIDRMLRLDDRRGEEVLAVIQYAHTPGNFWNGNLCSGQKLRDQFELVRSQMRRDGVMLPGTLSAIDEADIAEAIKSGQMTQEDADGVRRLGWDGYYNEAAP